MGNLWLGYLLSFNTLCYFWDCYVWCVYRLGSLVLCCLAVVCLFNLSSVVTLLLVDRLGMILYERSAI